MTLVRLRPLLGLLLLALLLAPGAVALAHGSGPQQQVDGYLVTLVVPEKGWYTGSNPVEVILWDASGMAVDATVTVGLLAFTPPGDGHGDSHGEAAPAKGRAADETDDHAANSHEAKAADDHNAATTDGHEDTTDNHGHDAANAIEGQGLALLPVALAPSEEPDVYAGALAFDEAGTYSVSVVFAIDGEERGAIFGVAVAQSRPRGLVLGGFALINALAVGAAGWLKYRTPKKPARRPARPAAAAPITPEE
jgi:hypothetical protein